MPGKQKSAFDMLSRSHRRLEEETAGLCDTLAGDMTEESCFIVEDALSFLARSGKNHMADEEETLFGRLSGQDGLIARLTEEHRQQEALLAELKAAVEAWPARPPSAEQAAAALALAKDLAAAYEAHTALEDADLLPLIASLDEATKQEMASEMQARRGKGGGGRGRNR